MASSCLKSIHSVDTTSAATVVDEIEPWHSTFIGFARAAARWCSHCGVLLAVDLRNGWRKNVRQAEGWDHGAGKEMLAKHFAVSLGLQIAV